MSRAVIIQSVVKQYRLPFFNKLHCALAECGVSLKVIYSDPNDTEARKNDNVELGEAVGIKVPAYWFLSDRILFQPILQHVLGADLVIVEQASKYVMNPVLLCLSKLGIKKVAFWGHGWNRQGNPETIAERFKRRLITAPDWWFAYTADTAKYLLSNGVRQERITNVQNAIDTKDFCESLTQVNDQHLRSMRDRLGILEDSFVGLFCGALYAHKHPRFLIEAAEAVKAEVPNFHLLVVGNGPEGDSVGRAAQKHSWVHSLGGCFGHDKAVLFRLSNMFLMPGLVGLAILDAFTAGLPIITTDLPMHGPEIEYLENGYNGVITAHDVSQYARAVINLARDHQQLSRLRDGALNSAAKYSIETMVSSFANGVMRCLGTEATIGSYARSSAS